MTSSNGAPDTGENRTTRREARRRVVLPTWMARTLESQRERKWDFRLELRTRHVGGQGMRRRSFEMVQDSPIRRTYSWSREHAGSAVPWRDDSHRRKDSKQQQIKRLKASRPGGPGRNQGVRHGEE